MARCTILCRSAYSLIQVARDIASVVDGEVILGHYNPFKVRGTVIIVGNPDPYFNVLVRAHLHNRQIWYITLEGPVRNRPPYQERAYIVANSKFTKAKAEESGIRVDDVIHHGVRYHPPPSLPGKDLDFIYIAGYLKRKYPPESRQVINHLERRLILATTMNNPYMRQWDYISIYDAEHVKRRYPDRVLTEERKLDLYRRAKFYLNLSTTEGFGLTVLEAMAFGCIPVLPEIPPFIEYIPRDLALWFPADAGIEYEVFGAHLIEHHHYRAGDVIELCGKVRWDPHLAQRCMEHAEKMHITNTYRRFNELI